MGQRPREGANAVGRRVAVDGWAPAGRIVLLSVAKNALIFGVFAPNAEVRSVIEWRLAPAVG